MASSDIDGPSINAMDAARTMRVTIHVRGVVVAVVRTKLASWLIKLALWVGGYHALEIIDESKRALGEGMVQ